MFSIENPGGGCNNPPSEDVLQKNIPQVDEGYCPGNLHKAVELHDMNESCIRALKKQYV